MWIFIRYGKYSLLSHGSRVSSCPHSHTHKHIKILNRWQHYWFGLGISTIKQMYFFIPSSDLFYLLIVGLECYCCTWSQSATHTLGRPSLEEWSARHPDLYLTTHNTHKKQTSMPGRDSNPKSQQRATADPHLRPRGHPIQDKYLILGFVAVILTASVV
jgi:hypothetical protein